jgi:hypothetical protein
MACPAEARWHARTGLAWHAPTDGARGGGGGVGLGGGIEILVDGGRLHIQQAAGVHTWQEEDLSQKRDQFCILGGRFSGHDEAIIGQEATEADAQPVYRPLGVLGGHRLPDSGMTAWQAWTGPSSRSRIVQGHQLTPWKRPALRKSEMTRCIDEWPGPQGKSASGLSGQGVKVRHVLSL